jgi:hypothetical protein
MPELEKTGEDMTEVVQDEDLTLDEDEIAEKYGNGPDLEGDFDMLDEENTYDLFETETDAEDTSKESGSEETKADWEDAEKRVSSFRQIFSYRNELENDDAEAGQSGGSSDAFADEDEEFEKLFGFRNTSIYEDDETDLDSGRSYGRTRFDDDDDFEYDDEYSYDEDDDVLSDDELDELADDDEDVSEGGKKKGGFFSRNPRRPVLRFTGTAIMRYHSPCSEASNSSFTPGLRPFKRILTSTTPFSGTSISSRRSTDAIFESA